MGVKKRTFVLLNTILFCILSFIFLIVVNSLGRGESALMVDLESLVYNHSLILLVCSFCIWSVFSVKKIASLLFPIYIVLILFSTLSTFVESFNKIILALNFIFIIISYYFYLLLGAELKEPYYNPFFSEYELSPYRQKGILIKVFDKNNEEIVGRLTNWGENGFFCKFEKGKSLGKVRFSLSFKDKVFEGSGKVVYHTKSGIGVLASNQTKLNLSWKDFYNIMDEFGIRAKVGNV